MMTSFLRQAAFFLHLAIAYCQLAACASEWLNHGGNILNHRSAIGPQFRINFKTVAHLALKWRFLTGFNVSATPSISYDGAIYFPGWNGKLYALDTETGRVIWEQNLTQVVGGLYGPGILSRTTPVIEGKLLMVGVHGPAVVLALDRQCGRLIWQTQPLDTAAGALITMSGTVFEGFYYIGVSSSQETSGCCTFQGSMQKLRLDDGSVVWKTSMLPKNSGYYGVALWGSSPPIDGKRRLLYIGTGNYYQVPASVDECESNRANNTLETEPDPCPILRDREDALMALNIDTGVIVWARGLEAYDVWTIPCQSSLSTPNCPGVLGPDYDFGEAPMLLHFGEGAEEQCLAIAGQKSGVVWALDCDNGTTIWSTVAGPGGTGGGASWGMCTDGERVYTNIINTLKREFVLAPSNLTTLGGGWVGLDGQTGRVIWSTAEPMLSTATGPVSCANGVVIVTSNTSKGDVYALHALTGTILWHGTTGANINGGFSIDEDCIYGGNGYAGTKVGVQVSAFCLYNP